MSARDRTDTRKVGRAQPAGGALSAGSRRAEPALRSPRTRGSRSRLDSQARLGRVARRIRGFSLIELVIVIAVLAIMASIAVPRFASAANHHRLSAAAMRVAHDLNLARARARASSTSVTVTFDLANHTYTIVGMHDIDHSSADYAVSLAKEPYGVRIGEADFDDDSEVVFDGYGVPDSGGTVIVTSGGRQEVISLDAGTGQARVLDPAEVAAGS